MKAVQNIFTNKIKIIKILTSRTNIVQQIIDPTFLYSHLSVKKYVNICTFDETTSFAVPVFENADYSDEDPNKKPKYGKIDFFFVNIRMKFIPFNIKHFKT